MNSHLGARHYLDHAAGTPLRPEALQAMTDLGWVGNPAASHTTGRRARAILEEARERLAEAIGSRPGEIVWTSGATEANNLAIQGAVSARDAEGRDKVVVTALDHPAATRLVPADAGRGTLVRATADGLVDEVSWAGALDERTAVASVCWVNNETGAVQDLPALTKAAHHVGSWLHADGVHALATVPVDFAGADLDLLTLSSHKVGGPIGVGALVVRRGLPLKPLTLGGGQEGGLRSGTPAVSLAAGFAAAATAAVRTRDSEWARVSDLRARLLHGIEDIPGVRMNANQHAAPGIVSLTITDTRGDDLMMVLDAAGIDCSTGSACSAGVHRPSEVLLAMGHSDAAASGSLRFSFGWSSTVADVDAVIATLPKAVERARLAFS